MYDGTLHDVTSRSTSDNVRPDLEQLKAIVREGQPIICFHNHPGEDGRAAMFPSGDDFELAGLVSFMTYAHDPELAVQFRIAQLGGEQETFVAYGFKGSALSEIKALAFEYSAATTRRDNVASIEAKQHRVVAQLAREASTDYLAHVCPPEPTATDAAACRTHPEYFLWPSDRFFIHHRAP